MSTIYTHDSGLEAININGVPRLLASLPTPANVLRQFRPITDVMKIVPVSEYVEIKRRDVFDPNLYVIDQKSHGSCVGFAAAGALMKCRALSGQKHERLSGAYVYSFINGGQDQGASIGDALGVLINKGTCLETEVPWNKIYPRDIPSSAAETAKRFRLEEGYVVKTFEEACSAIQLGFTLEFAVMVGNNFDRLDSEGVIGFDRGPGNHAVHAFGMVKSDKWGWLLDCGNSWSTGWGDNGMFRVSKQHWDGVYQDAFALRAASTDANDPNFPPKVAA